MIRPVVSLRATNGHWKQEHKAQLMLLSDKAAEVDAEETEEVNEVDVEVEDAVVRVHPDKQVDNNLPVVRLVLLFGLSRMLMILREISFALGMVMGPVFCSLAFHRA